MKKNTTRQRGGTVPVLSNGLTKKQAALMLENGIDPTLYIQKHDPTAPSAVPVHGVGGMFSEPGARPDMFSAIVRPNTFLSALPVVQSQFYNELVSILTAQSATVGSNPDGTCGDPVTPGNLHKATIARRFGKVYVGSDKVDVTEIGMLANRADVERIILNSAATNPLIPDLLAQPNVNFRSESAHQLWRAGLSFERALASIDVTGNSSLTGASAEDGFLREFDGLERLITNGITDTSGVAAPAADSLVVTWGSTMSATVGGRRLGRLLYEVIYSRQQLAQDTGIPVSSWALVMDKRLFFELAYEMAVFYATIKSSDATDPYPINRNAEAIESRYNAMIQGNRLTVGAFTIPVLFTSGAETTANASTGVLTSDLFLVALDALGNPVTYLEYFPMNNQFISEFNGLSNTTGRMVLNNGLYMMAVRSSGFCDQILLAGHLRMMCRAPFLCARIDDISYNPYAGFRSAFPGATGYEGGGVSSYS